MSAASVERGPTAPAVEQASLIVLAAALLIGALARFWHLFARSLFLDEGFTFDAAARAPHELLVQIAQHDAHPPLFYLATHAIMVAAPQMDPHAYRALTAPLGLLTILATWGVARRALGPVAAAIAALIVATEPALVQLDRFYRMYAPLAALTACSWWLLAEIPHAKGVKRTWMGIAYVAAAALLPATQYLGAFVVLSQAGFAWCTRGGDRGRAILTATGVLAGAAGLAWWLPMAFSTQFHQGGYAGVASVTQAWWEVPAGALGYALPVEWYRNAAFADGFAIASVALTLAGAWIARGTVLPWYLAPIAVQAALTAATGKDLVLSRYLIHLVPAFAVAAGAVGAALLATPARVAGVAVVVALLACNGAAVTNELLDPLYQTPDWDLVGRIVASEARPSDAVVLDDGYPFLILRSMPALRGRETSAPSQPAQLPATIDWIAARPHARIWYVENQYYYADPDRRVLAQLERTRPRLREWLEPRADLSNRVYIALFGPAMAGGR